jgi:hypothetical protein
VGQKLCYTRYFSLSLSLSYTEALTIDKCGVKFVTPSVGQTNFDMLWDFDKFRSQCYKYSGCKKYCMWGKRFVRPAVGLGQILSLSLSLLYSGLKINEMWGKSFVRAAVRQI